MSNTQHQWAPEAQLPSRLPSQASHFEASLRPMLPADSDTPHPPGLSNSKTNRRGTTCAGRSGATFYWRRYMTTPANCHGTQAQRDFASILPPNMYWRDDEIQEHTEHVSPVHELNSETRSQLIQTFRVVRDQKQHGATCAVPGPM